MDRHACANIDIVAMDAAHAHARKLAVRQKFCAQFIDLLEKLPVHTLYVRFKPLDYREGFGETIRAHASPQDYKSIVLQPHEPDELPMKGPFDFKLTEKFKKEITRLRSGIGMQNESRDAIHTLFQPVIGKGQYNLNEHTPPFAISRKDMLCVLGFLLHHPEQELNDAGWAQAQGWVMEQSLDQATGAPRPRF